MASIVCLDRKEQYIPDFVEVLYEFFGRTIKNDSPYYESTMAISYELFKFKYIPNINNAMPYCFLMYSSLRKISKKVKLSQFFTTYCDYMIGLLNKTTEEHKLALKFSRPVKTKNDDIKLSPIQGHQSIRKFYLCRNFVEMMFMCIEAIIPI